MDILMEEEPVTEYVFYFRVPHIDRNFYWTFGLNTTISQFISSIKGELENEHIDILETAQYGNLNGRDPELVSPIDYPESATLTDIFGERWKKTAFYIRLRR